MSYLLIRKGKFRKLYHRCTKVVEGDGKRKRFACFEIPAPIESLNKREKLLIFPASRHSSIVMVCLTSAGSSPSLLLLVMNEQDAKLIHHASINNKAKSLFIRTPPNCTLYNNDICELIIAQSLGKINKMTPQFYFCNKKP